MKGTMSEFIHDMVEDSFERLDELMLGKYPEFIEIYWILKPFAAMIERLRYDASFRDALRVEILAGKTSSILTTIGSDIDAYHNEEFSVSYETKESSNKMIIVIQK